MGHAFTSAPLALLWPELRRSACLLTCAVRGAPAGEAPLRRAGKEREGEMRKPRAATREMDSEAAATTGKKKKKKGAAKEVETEAVQATDDAHDAPRNTEGRTESGEEKQDTTEDAGPADADAEARSEALEAVHAGALGMVAANLTTLQGEDGIPEEEVEAEAGEAEERGLALEAVPGAGYGAAAAGLEEAPEDEAEEAEEGDTGKKKGGGTVSGLDGIANYGISDEDFDAWCQKTLEATANESEKMSSQDLQKPPREFWGYQYSGNLRPAYVSKQLRMPEGTLLPDYALQADGSSACERQGLKEAPESAAVPQGRVWQSATYGR
eukprot:s7918_g2.t1